MQLTEKDIKTIKYEKRIGFVFSSIILLFGGLINIFHSFNFLSAPKIDMTQLILIDCIIIGASILIPYVMNKKYNQDLNEGMKFVKIEKIQKKEIDKSYEAGSATISGEPSLKILAPKLYKREMKESLVYNLFINGASYEVEKGIYDSVNIGDTIEMHYSIHSDILLDIRKKI